MSLSSVYSEEHLCNCCQAEANAETERNTQDHDPVNHSLR